jgi:hypothetical protein
MQKGHRLQIACKGCKQPIEFSVFELEKGMHQIECAQCHKIYLFEDETLLRQIKLFDTLCRTIRDSEEILSHTAVGIDVGDRHVKIPYKILLSRLSSNLDLKVGDEHISMNQVKMSLNLFKKDKK